MNRAEIIKAIADAGASFEDAEELQKFLPAFYAFEKIVAAKERERVAKLVEIIREDWVHADNNHSACAADYVVQAVRALGDE